MPRARKASKRKVPVTAPQRLTSNAQSSKTPAATRAIIRQFHVLNKRKAQLFKSLEDNDISSRDRKNVEDELKAIDQEMEKMGGLEVYQKMSVIGQGNDRGGGSEKVLLAFLEELGYPKSLTGKRWSVLEVGALKPDNYASCSQWMDVTPIDLHSRHPNILEQDFLKMDEEENREKWDLICLSLVVNFVPEPKDRGRMLQIAHAMLRQDAYLFLALPLPCVTNSRYLTFDHLKQLMQALSFVEVKDRWKQGGKMAYWLYQKIQAHSDVDKAAFNRKEVLRQGNRNNFCILL